MENGTSWRGAQIVETTWYFENACDDTETTRSCANVTQQEAVRPSSKSPSLCNNDLNARNNLDRVAGSNLRKTQIVIPKNVPKVCPLHGQCHLPCKV